MWNLPQLVHFGYWCFNMIGKLFSRSKIDTVNYRFFKVSESLYLVGLFFHLGMIPLMFALGADIIAEYNFLSVTVYLGSIALNRKGHHSLAFLIFYTDTNVNTFLSTHYLGWETGFYNYILLLAALTYFNPQWSIKIKLASSLLLTTSFTYLFANYHDLAYGNLVLSDIIGHYLLYTNTFAIVILYSAIGYYYSSAANISEQKLMKAQMAAEQIANTDPLTQIGNRRFMTSEIERETSRSNRKHSSFIIALCDIDNFKQINDVYGHDFGDTVLVNMANTIVSNIRKHDQAARWGGEEFMILLPDTTAEEGVALIERLRDIIASATHKYKGKETITVTMTFGLCRYNSEYNINDCICRADRALYKGKHNGKNCTVMSDDSGKSDITQHQALAG